MDRARVLRNTLAAYVARDVDMAQFWHPYLSRAPAVPDHRGFAETLAVAVMGGRGIVVIVGEVGTRVRRDVRPIGSEVHAARRNVLSLALFRSDSYAHTRRDTHAAVVIRDVNVPDWRAFAEARAVSVLLRW